jgi:DNA repair protein RadC
MGPAKYVQLLAVFEMVRRALEEELKIGDAMNSPKSVRDYFRLSLEGKKHEIFVGIFLDAQNRAIATGELFNGRLTQTSVYPREVVKRAFVVSQCGGNDFRP